MAETAQATPIQQAKQQQLNKGYISGRITAQRRIQTANGPLHLTVLRLPSVDEYSHPATVELRSGYKLADIGEDWSGAVKLGGMPNNYEVKNRDTGEVERIISARNEYQVID